LNEIKYVKSQVILNLQYFNIKTFSDSE